MIWRIKDKEEIVRTCFAFFPKKIGEYRVWLSRYYKTWDWYCHGPYYGYTARYFVFKENAENHVKEKAEKS